MYQGNKNSSRDSRQPTDDIQSLILDLARVTRVQRGGKRLRFRCCIGIGDKKGKVGVGIAKGTDVSMAVEKATRRAKRDSIQIKITETASIPHSARVKFKAAQILFKPAPSGTGIKAGGVIRILCDLAGIENITAKILGTNNKITNAQAFIKAFQNMMI